MLKEKFCKVCQVKLVKGDNWYLTATIPLCKKHFYETSMKISHKRYSSTQKGKEAINKASKKSQKRYPFKSNARHLVQEAVRKGKLARLACKVCGNFLSEAHHPNYSKPLEVVWLCIPHHRLADKGKLTLHE